MRQPRGVALIVVAGVLAVLAAMVTAFYMLMVMQTRSAVRHSDSVRAEMMAKAGVEDAVTRLREQAYRKTEDPTDPWYTVDYLKGAKKRISFPAQIDDGIDNDGDGTVDNAEEALSYSRAMGAGAGAGSDRYTLRVTDAASRININACDNLAVVLDNLCRLIGPPLTCADQNLLMPMRWKAEGSAFGSNPDDKINAFDAYYGLDADARPITATNDGNGQAKYGDGYAIAGYRARHGKFLTLTDVKNALTFVRRNTGNAASDRQIEQLEREVKFAALKDYITVDSWVDTNTVGVGKFEWVTVDTGSGKTVAIDRDKSWIADDLANDPKNLRGSLRGCYVSIISGHGAGQLRRIRTNGIDWIEVESGFAVVPGPVSGYVIISREDAPLVDAAGAAVSEPPPAGKLTFPKTDPATGTLIDHPDIDYVRHPLCMHRAPININTASDKVLAALFLGMNVQWGHPMAIATDAELGKLIKSPLKARAAWAGGDSDWKIADFPGRNQEAYIITPKGLKRIPADSGRLVVNRPMPTASPDFAYLGNYSALTSPQFVMQGAGVITEAHELAYRIIMARTRTKPAGVPDPDPTTADAVSGFPGYERGAFKSWDDFYFRVVKPWDDIRSYPTAMDVPYSGNPAKKGQEKVSVARMIMANFNSNTDIMKFNPNIEWIDRWGRNFTEMEPVMAYTDANEPHGGAVPLAEPLQASSIPIFAQEKENTIQWGLITLRPFGAVGANEGAYMTRSFRYKSDEMLDKTDLNRSTTEFSFDSGGIYEIQSVGQVVSSGNVLAERKIEALVKVYDVWRESTQRQFVQGTISKAAPTDNTIDSFAHSGSVTRDAVNATDKLGLQTMPEPLVPLQYRINNPNNTEIVDRASTARDAYGNAKANINVPDVVANKVLPAGYDGQICLATNTLRFDQNNDKDSFLASFNGDLDTDTSAGNGREQAKIPHTPAGDGDKYRVVDTCGLLGVLNDTLVDVDPGAPANNPRVFHWTAYDNALKGLNPDYYWNNVSCRMGDLRPDGVFLGVSGTGGNDATLKYVFGANKENFNPGSDDGCIVSMWMKPSWHWNDHRTHEFFNASNPSEVPGRAITLTDGKGNPVSGGKVDFTSARACYLVKWGNLYFATDGSQKQPYTSAEGYRLNDLNFELEGNVKDFWGGQLFLQDWDHMSFLHGGYAHVDPMYQDGTAAPGKVESPSYRIQPFRWHYTGTRFRYNAAAPRQPRTQQSAGHWIENPDGADPENKAIIGLMGHPFISTQAWPETPTGINPDFYYAYASGRGIPGGDPDGFTAPCDIGNPGPAGQVGKYGGTGQDVKWHWADPAGVYQNTAGEKVFSINNLNQDNEVWIYRHLPADGTYAVIDELKISNKDKVLQNAPDWTNDRAVKEQTLSRYYLPPSPADPAQCPTFTSQSMLQSLRGYDKTVSSEEVTIVRVSWTVFTPRFMHENKVPTVDRVENMTRDLANQQKLTVKFRGPFDDVKYNDDDDTTPWGVYRNLPVNGTQGHFTKGVEVELLDGGGLVGGTGTFVDPDKINQIGAFNAPTKIRTNKLHYRVRFRYPVDAAVDPNAAGNSVDPNKHYLLDTPVFDDISIVYVKKPKFLSYREVTE